MAGARGCTHVAARAHLSAPDEVRTERLLLRRWRDSDLEPFAALNADPRVMELFPAPLGRVDSDAFVDRIRRRWLEHGFGPWAVETLDQGIFIGSVGLSRLTFEAHFTPGVEVAWRLCAA